MSIQNLVRIILRSKRLSLKRKKLNNSFARITLGLVAILEPAEFGANEFYFDRQCNSTFLYIVFACKVACKNGKTITYTNCMQHQK